MNSLYPLVLFSLDQLRYALHLSSVRRVIRAVEVAPLPKAPDIVDGIINLQGEIIPVFRIRRRFAIPERETSPSDHFLIAQTVRRSVALIADAVDGLVTRPKQDIIAAEAIHPRLKYVEGVLKLQDGLVLIHDLGKFLSLTEEKTLDQALEAHLKGQR